MSSKISIDIDVNTLKTPDNIKCLIDAANDVLSASEADFEHMKEKYWYKRIWGMVTFSKDNEKQLAKGVSNLAKIQEIIIKMLLVMSNENVQIYELITEHSGDIRKLSEHDVALANKINRLENRYILGISPQTDIASLSELERQILGGLLNYLMKKFEQVSAEQQKYANAILNYLKVEEQEIDISESIKSINSIDTRKKMLTCCMEYGFLNKFNFDYLGIFSDILKCFLISEITPEIQKNIEATYNLRGVDGFIDKYRYYEFEEFEDEIFIELEENIEENEMEITEVTISNILHIAQDEIKKFKYNDIHINSCINCEGDLLFEKCVIYYNESEALSGIILATGASLQFINCKIICKNTCEIPFIQGRNGEILLQECDLYDCSYFIQMDSEAKIQIDSCEINNPSKNFLEGDEIEGFISNCCINFSKIPKQNVGLIKSKDSDTLLDDAVFDVFSRAKFGSENNEMKEFIVKDCIVSGDELFDREAHAIWVFNIYGGIYENCSFTNINNCISTAREVSKSNFLKCEDVITFENIMLDTTEWNKNIIRCTFERCERVVVAGKNSSIKNCQFLKCKNEIISLSVFGNVIIEFCEFIEIAYEMPYENSNGACLCLGKFGDAGSPSIVTNCIFNNVNVGDGFLIMAGGIVIDASMLVYIKNCSFQNCVTKRESGKIIKEYANVLEKRRFNEVKVVMVSDCKGLNKVIKY